MTTTTPLPVAVARRALALAVSAAAGLGALSACGGNDITAARLQASLAPTFAHLYADQAAILGHPGTTPASTGTSVACTKGGPKVPDVGPGANWACMITFTDTAGAAQTGKFEVNAHANSCWTAGGPSKLIGPATITNGQGRDVANPVAEFDGCFNPGS